MLEGRSSSRIISRFVRSNRLEEDAWPIVKAADNLRPFEFEVL